MIIIALGSNLDFGHNSPKQNLLGAIEAIDRLYPCPIRSSFYLSPAWPNPQDPPFLNAVIASYESADPHVVLASLHGIEAAFGRRRSVRNAARTLDLDLLAIDDLVITPPNVQSPEYGLREQGLREGNSKEDQHIQGFGLVLPHPAIAQRDFVLVPLSQCLPDWHHPVTGLSVREMCENLQQISAKIVP